MLYYSAYVLRTSSQKSLFCYYECMTKDPQQALDNFIAEYLTPFLERQGFKRTARSWSRKRDGYSEIISIQADKWNSRNEHAKFFVNYGLYSAPLFEEFFESTTPRRPTYWDCVLGNRLLNSAGDELWSVYSPGRKHFFKRRENVSGKLLLNAINNQAIKAFDVVKDVDQIRALHGSGRGQHLLKF